MLVCGICVPFLRAVSACNPAICFNLLQVCSLLNYAHQSLMPAALRCKFIDKWRKDKCRRYYYYYYYYCY